MRRFHVHISVEDIGQSVAFYSALFGCPPSVVKSDYEELDGVQRRMAAAGAASTEERATPCCYAESDKHWINDPQGVPWEAFHTLQEIPVYGLDSGPRSPGTSVRRVIPIKVAALAGSCCETPQK